MSEKFEVSPIAYIHTDFSEKFGVPRQSGRVRTLVAEIEFLPEFSAREAFRGIEEFSYLWLIFDFSLSHRDTFSPTVRPPRLGGNERVGVFATRSPFRPNSLGLSSVKLLEVKWRGNVAVLVVSGADLVNMTPIYDIKPYIPYSDCHPDARGSYAEIHSGHFLKVDFPEELLLKIPKDKQTPLIDCLADDPRPSYKEEGERVYTMRFSDFDVSFKVKSDTVCVIKVEKV